MPSFDSLGFNPKPRNVNTNNLPTYRENKSNLTPIDEATHSPSADETINESTARLESRIVTISNK